MTGMRFDPWLGDHYLALREARDSNNLQSSTFAYPIHLLGESHYGQPEEDHRDFTRRTVMECAFEPGPNSAFFAKALKAVTGRELDEIDRRDTWHRLAFCNYVQRLLPASREAPSAEMWSEAAGSFPEMLAAVRAPILAVMGWRLWEQIPAAGGVRLPPLCDLTGEEIIESSWAYEYETPVGRRVTLAVPITHPSGRGFEWPVAHKRIQTALLNYDNVLSSFETKWSAEC